MGTAGAPTAAASHGAIALSRSPGHCQWHPGQPETRPGARSVTVGSLSPRLGHDAEACSGHASRRPRRAALGPVPVGTAGSTSESPLSEESKQGAGGPECQTRAVGIRTRRRVRFRSGPLAASICVARSTALAQVHSTRSHYKLRPSSPSHYKLRPSSPVGARVSHRWPSRPCALGLGRCARHVCRLAMRAEHGCC